MRANVRIRIAAGKELRPYKTPKSLVTPNTKGEEGDSP